MAKIFLFDVKELRGEEQSILLALKQFNEAAGRTGRKYLKMLLFDRSGESDARCFDGYEKILPELRNGNVYKFRAIPDSFNNKEYLKVLSIGASTEFDPGDFIPVAPHDPGVMLASMREHVAMIGNPFLRQLTDIFLSDAEWVERFSRWPAAKEWHHSYMHGLLEHTLSVMKLVVAVTPRYPDLDRDLLLAGAFFHDIGKLDEYQMNGVMINISTRGRLLGHIITGSTIIEKAIQSIPDFPPGTSQALLHLIVSHHGQLEWGSPKQPAFREAVILHLLDYLDSQLTGMHSLQPGTVGGEWSDFNKFMDRQVFLYHRSEGADTDGSQR
ncbi:MAG: HD domain-containing protein [Candidatus Wallbacteria bacterium]|nr:HD domain-containing protein [Candidatus Wallbacteria bacterium]